VLLTRAPLYSWYCYHFLARLACVRHAASVDSEPGSNSRLKNLMSVSSDGGQSRSTVPTLTISRLLVQGTLLVRMIKPNLIHSHNWHVQPSCQRSVRAFRLSGALFGSRSGLLHPAVPELDALGQIALFSAPGCFCANLLNLSNFLLYVKLLFSSHPGPLKFHSGGGSPQR
jgi:hypothetical protein